MVSNERLKQLANGQYAGLRSDEKEQMARELLSLREEQARRKWIPCSERMPEPSKRCLIVCDGIVQHVSYMRIIGYSRAGVYKWWANDVFEVDPIPDSEVSHWMPLPNPPKEDDNAVQ